jgi:hypothetical protein
MKNKFTTFKLMDVHAIHGKYRDKLYLPNVLVDAENNQLIYCVYELNDEGDKCTGVLCKLVKTPVVMLDSRTVQVSWSDMVEKFNRKNCKLVDYDELCIAFDVENNPNGKFSVFM